MMTVQAKIQQLRSLIRETLTPLINHDYVLLDVPYYNNIGDVLIWDGTRDWLKTLPYKCLRVSSKDSFDFPVLSTKTIIIMMGGGNFGDLYRSHQLFRNKVISYYLDNKIIVLPQTIFYKSWYTFRQDAKILQKHKNLTICARDRYSHFLLKFFKICKNVLLLPDMALCIDKEKLPTIIPHQNGLFVRRLDGELASYDYNKIFSQMSNIYQSDWPTYETNKSEWLNLKQYMMSNDDCLEQYADFVFRPALVHYGINFLLPYETIYSTRLHAFILAVLLGKKVVVFDNLYGKNSDFIHTWFAECEQVILVKSYQVNVKRIQQTMRAIIKLMLQIQ